MSTSYTPGGVAGLLTEDNSNNEKDKDTNLVALFSTPPTKPKKSKKLQVIGNDEVQSTTSEDQTKKRRKRKKENELVAVREAIFDGDTPASKKPKPESSKKKPKKIVKNDENVDERTIFVGNLSSATNKKVVMKMFRRFGKIENARIRSAISADLKVPQKVAVIKKELHPVKNTVNAYLVFESKDSAEKALTFNGKLVEGIHIRVDALNKSSKTDNSRSVFIGNVPFDSQEESVREYFSQCGNIENVRLIRDKKTGLGKGFGYVLFQDKSSVTLALQLGNTETTFRGRILRISRCKDEGKAKKVAKPPKKPKDKMKIKDKAKSSHQNSRPNVPGTTKNEANAIVNQPKATDKQARKHSLKKKIKQKMMKGKKEKLGTFLIGTNDKQSSSSDIKGGNKSSDSLNKPGKNKRKREKKLKNNPAPKKASRGKPENSIYARNRLAKKSKSS